jgi:REP-associated tyrosine transposase
MVRYRRNYVPGGTYFFTVTLADRRSAVLTENIAALRPAFRATHQEHPFNLDAIVVLPEHLHAIMTLPDDDADFSGRWRRIKSMFTRAVVGPGMHVTRNSRGEYRLWQRRFWEHTITSDEDFEQHVEYVHYNPVKHGLVPRVADWPYSSFHRYVRAGLVPEDWAGCIRESARGYGEREVDRS